MKQQFTPITTDPLTREGIIDRLRGGFDVNDTLRPRSDPRQGFAPIEPHAQSRATVSKLYGQGDILHLLTPTALEDRGALQTWCVNSFGYYFSQCSAMGTDESVTQDIADAVRQLELHYFVTADPLLARTLASRRIQVFAPATVRNAILTQRRSYYITRVNPWWNAPEAAAHALGRAYFPSLHDVVTRLRDQEC